MKATKRVQQQPSAIVWVDDAHAIVACTAPDGGISTEKVDRGSEPETTYLAHVVHEIGDSATVSIIGPSSVRLALEREFVSISHRPERIVGIPMTATSTGYEILARMRRLAA